MAYLSDDSVPCTTVQYWFLSFFRLVSRFSFFFLVLGFPLSHHQPPTIHHQLFRLPRPASGGSQNLKILPPFWRIGCLGLQLVLVELL
jgi:hypothetical protein